MAKVCFPFIVNYNGTRYPANVPFEVPDKEASTLVKQGGWLIEEKQAVRSVRKAAGKATKKE